MEEKIKIKIGINAYDDLKNLLNFHSEYKCVRLSLVNGCKGPSKVELVLDNSKTDDIIDVIDDLTFCYNKEVLQLVKGITIVLKNGNILLKTQLTEDALNKVSSNNNSKCGSCKSCSSCNSCQD